MLRGKASYGQAGSGKTYTMGSAAAHALELEFIKDMQGDLSACGWASVHGFCHKIAHDRSHGDSQSECQLLTEPGF